MIFIVPNITYKCSQPIYHFDGPVTTIEHQILSLYARHLISAFLYEKALIRYEPNI